MAMRPEPIELGPAKRILMAHSMTEPGKFHFAIELEKPVMVKRFGGEVLFLCSCKGYHNHRKCWHTDDLKTERIAYDHLQEFHRLNYHHAQFRLNGELSAWQHLINMRAEGTCLHHLPGFDG